MRKIIRGALALFVLLLMSVGLGVSPASAHANAVTGSASCQADGTYTVTWTIANDYSLAETSVTLVSYTGGGSLSGLPTTIAKSPAKATVTQSGIPGSTTSASLKVKGTWSDGYHQNDQGFVSLKGDCKPTQPDPLKGTDKGTNDPVCVQPLNGQATVTSWTQDWTQAYVWNGSAWVLGQKSYSPKVETTKTVDARSCLPDKPAPLTGTDKGSYEPICVSPPNGTSTTTTWTQSWTQPYVWSNESHSWVLGQKSYDAKVEIKGDPVPDSSCSTTVTPVAPTPTEVTCTTGTTVTLPTTTGVVYSQSTADGVITVKAVPAEGYVFPEEAQITWTFEVQPPLACAVPVRPGFHDSTCSATQAYILLPPVDGVVYSINGVVAKSGVHFVSAGTYVVTAASSTQIPLAEGAATKWTFVAHFPECGGGAPPTCTGDDCLPQTGSAAEALASWGAIALLLGSTLAFLGRRRRA